MQYIQYILPIIFLVLGIVIQTSKDPRWASSKKMGKVLIVLGIITLIARLVLYFAVSK